MQNYIEISSLIHEGNQLIILYMISYKTLYSFQTLRNTEHKNFIPKPVLRTAETYLPNLSCNLIGGFSLYLVDGDLHSNKVAFYLIIIFRFSLDTTILIL